MTSCPPLAPPEKDCIPIAHPCEVYAQLENAIVARAVSGGSTGYRVGEESFQFSHLSFADLKALRDEYHARCAATGACPPPVYVKRRAKVCFVPGDHYCRLCGTSSCGCGS